MTIALRSGVVFRDIREISCFRKKHAPVLWARGVLQTNVGGGILECFHS